MKQKIFAITVLLLGITSFIKLPDPDSDPFISCTSLFVCPGAKTTRGFPIPYSFYTDNGVNHSQLAYGLIMNILFYLAIAAIATYMFVKFLPRKIRPGSH